MEKRGQVTVFVVVGLLILIILSVVFVIISTRNRIAESEITASTLDEVRRQVNLDVKLCFENIVEAGILDSSRHGGEAILWNSLSEGTSTLNPCNIIPTATQEIRMMYNPELTDDCDAKVTNLDSRAETTISSINIPDIDKYAFKFISTLPNEGVFDSYSLERYIRDKLPRCLREFKDYRTKGWSIESNDGWESSDDFSGSIKEYLDTHNAPDPNKKAIIVDPGTPQACPLDGRLLVKLNMPLKFSKESRIGKEESFILDNQEFIYNADLTYFYKKIKELFSNLYSLSSDDLNNIKITELNNNPICSDCTRLTSTISSINNDVMACEDSNGCHFYKATDPNTGAYMFNIKCGEYYFILRNQKTINGKEIVLTEGDNDKIKVKVSGFESDYITKGTTVNIGGLDITYDKQRDSGEYVLLVGKGVSFLWGYYFGCGLPDPRASSMCDIST
ncbi:hypothetical protein HYV88_05565 [Candidatus Woesearchaeota archaeon]|nr:hypothetical protein [Candidatus Woesearchaeota archaeon]